MWLYFIPGVQFRATNKIFKQSVDQQSSLESNFLIIPCPLSDFMCLFPIVWSYKMFNSRKNLYCLQCRMK